MSGTNLPQLIAHANPRARLAWDEFFGGMIRNPHTRNVYLWAMRRLLTWAGFTQAGLETAARIVKRKHDQSHPGRYE